MAEFRGRFVTYGSWSGLTFDSNFLIQIIKKKRSKIMEPKNIQKVKLRSDLNIP